MTDIKGKYNVYVLDHHQQDAAGLSPRILNTEKASVELDYNPTEKAP